MHDHSIRPILAIGLILLSACGGSGGPPALDGAIAQPPLVVADQQLPRASNGEAFTFIAPPGALLAVYFGYTQCPDLCPTTLATLKVALSELDADDAGRVTVALVTVDPDRDAPELLDSYLSSFFDAEHRVALRSTHTESLARVQAAFLASSALVHTAHGVAAEHSATTSIVTDQGVVAVQWPFGTSAGSMAHDLRILLATNRR